MADWEQAKARLKEKITEIAENDLFVNGRQKEELLLKLEARLGMTREAIVRLISEM